MQPNNQLDYTPMPGEIMKNKSGETGEIQNPYYDEGFENLAEESSEQQVEEQTQDQEKPIPAESGNALENELNQQWAEGHVDINAAEQQVQSDFIEGAVEQSTTSENAEADMAAAEKSSTNTPDSEQPKDINQPREISNAAAMKAISADVLSDDITEKVKAGDEEAMAKIGEVEQRAAEAEALADKIGTTAENNATSEQEIQMASSVANQVHEMAQEAIENVNEAKAEYDSMSEEEKEETKEAAEAAEANGTDIETEKDNILSLKTEQANQKNPEDKKDNEDSQQYRIIS